MDRRVRGRVLRAGGTFSSGAYRRGHDQRAPHDLGHRDGRGACGARAAARLGARRGRYLAFGRDRRSVARARPPEGAREAGRRGARSLPHPAAHARAARRPRRAAARSCAQRDRCLRRPARRSRPYPGSVPRGRGARLGEPPAGEGDRRLPGQSARRRLPARRRRRLRAAVHRVQGEARADRSRGKGPRNPACPHRRGRSGRSGGEAARRPGQARLQCAQGLRSLRMILRPAPGFVFAHPAHFIALGFGTGLAPLAPRTVGTLLALPLFILLDLWLPPLYLFTVIVVFFGIGIWACGRTGRDLGIADHSAMNWDEVVAMLLVLLLAPSGWAWWGFAFFAFRFFDVVKPPPIRHIDRAIKGGLGVMFDDTVAAFYTLLLIAVVKRVL